MCSLISVPPEELQGAGIFIRCSAGKHPKILFLPRAPAIARGALPRLTAAGRPGQVRLPRLWNDWQAAGMELAPRELLPWPRCLGTCQTRLASLPTPARAPRGTNQSAGSAWGSDTSPNLSGLGIFHGGAGCSELCWCLSSLPARTSPAKGWERHRGIILGVLPLKSWSHLHLPPRICACWDGLLRNTLLPTTGQEEPGWAGGTKRPPRWREPQPAEECLIHQKFPTVHAKNKASGKAQSQL